jgi:hypothetical protein
VSEDTRGRVRRRLAAILVAGLSRLFPGDEKERFTGLRAFLTDVIDPLIPEFEGNIFKHTSELVLIEFDSVVEATRCAAALREAVVHHNQGLANEERLAMRIYGHLQWRGELSDRHGHRHPRNKDAAQRGASRDPVRFDLRFITKLDNRPQDLRVADSACRDGQERPSIF